VSSGGNTVDVILRALTIASTCVLVGLLPVALLVLRPSAGRPQALSHRATPEVLRLRRVLASAALMGIVAAVASTARLVQVFHALTPEQPLAATVGDALRSDLGAWTALRVPVVLALAVVVRATWVSDNPHERYRMGSNAGAWAPLAALLCLTLPMTSHAWARGGATGVAVDVVHIAAGSVWLAGVLALAVVVPVGLRTGSASRRREVLLGSAAAFSRLAVVAVAVAVATGLVQAGLGGVGVQDIAGTAWGTAAAAKLWLFAAVLVAGLVNHRVLIRGLDRARNRVRIQANSSLLLASVSLEVVLGIALVFAAALLVSVPQP
jgi:putative copper export protein